MEAVSRKGWWMAMVDLRDPDVYRRCIGTNAAAFSNYGPRFEGV
jgi:uncharacterized protein (DUF1330 family)